MALPPNYYGGSAVPRAQQDPYGNASRQQAYGSGLGGIQQFGYANPYGPFSGLQRATTGGTTAPMGSGGSTTTSSSGPTPTAEAWMNDVLAGKNLPFSPFAKSQMLSQQSDMSAAAEGARNGQMMGAAAMGGASASDPSLQGARMSNMAARQAQNQTAARDIDVQANTANFGAQMDAASMLNQNAMNREAFQNGVQRTALGFMPWNQAPLPDSQRQQNYINFTGFQGGGNATGRAPANEAPLNQTTRRPQTTTRLTPPVYGPAVNTGSTGPLRYDDSMWD